MPRASRLDGLADLLDRQLSVASRGQLLALGMKDTAMQYRVRQGGPWQTLLPGVYLAANGLPSLAQKEVAALIYAGPGSLITGPVALMHHSIRNNGNLEVIDMLVPVERQRLSSRKAQPAPLSPSAPRESRKPVRFDGCHFLMDREISLPQPQNFAGIGWTAGVRMDGQGKD